jgi:hypothetical protein
MSALKRLWDVEQAARAGILDLAAREQAETIRRWQEGEIVESELVEVLRDWGLIGEEAKKGLDEPGPGRRRLAGRDRSEQVAEVYMRAAKSPGRVTPTKAVAEAFNVSHSTATKWVGIARREYGLLPATTAGKPSDPYKEPARPVPAKRPGTRNRKGSAR